MHRGKVDPGVSELFRDHVNRPLVWLLLSLLSLFSYSKAINFHALAINL